MEWTVEVSSRLDGVKALWPDSVAIVTGSPGRFAKGSQATKEDWCTSTLYLPTWSTEELADVFEFSADLFHEYGGVARLWVMRAKRPDDASEYIEKAFAAVNPEKFIQMQSGDIKETSQVHRLLDIGEKKGNIEGFISKAVADKAMALAVEAARGNIEEYVARVVATGGVFAKTYIGHLFEAYFSSAFGKRETGLKYDETNLQLRAGGECVPFTESVQCDDDVLYKPEKRNFYGIDCFVLRSETVIVLQVTVGKTHTPVSEEHPDIKKLTNTFSNKRFLLVYVVPSAALAETFRVPQGNPSAWTVRVGYPENDEFAVYGNKLPDVPLLTETPLKCQHCDAAVTPQGTPFASPSGLETHERSCPQTTA